jgi:hypothetical protein|tara:strand:+ start:288 stop:521 length:234 start_codon:yes stop_codon:yes gene_type:complete
MDLKYGPLRDKLLKELSDGEVLTSKEIEEKVSWPKKTNIVKTLSDLKIDMVVRKDSRKLLKIFPEKARGQFKWKLVK